MNLRRIFLAFSLISLVALSAAAQQGPQTDIARLFQIKVKNGHAAQFEEAYKQHLAWHTQQKDTWEWSAWQFDTGEEFGQYIIRTGNHTWADFDNRGAMGVADGADAQQRLTPHTEETKSWLARGLLDISHWPDRGTPPAMILVSRYHLHQGAEQDWLFAVRKIHEALRKANAPFRYYFSETVAGEEEPSFAIVSPRDKWTDMNPPEKSFVEMVEGVLGRQETAELLQRFSKAVHCSSSNILRHRPDLSYTPPAM